MAEVAPAPYLAQPHEVTLNLAIGRDCPVHCYCYNYFGETALRGELISAGEVIDFAAEAAEIGVDKVTLSGGDPLLRPDIVQIVQGIALPKVIDTVGTTLLQDTPVKYKGRGIAPQVHIASIAPFVRMISLPVDGIRQETIEQFRQGRPNLLEEIKAASIMVREHTGLGFNCVANQYSIHELAGVVQFAEQYGAALLQIFEHDPTGPNRSNRHARLQLAPGQFAAATRDLRSDTVRVECKSLDDRDGAYFLVNDAGMAWRPNGDTPIRIGHITRDRSLVLDALKRHVAQKKNA